MVNFTDDNDNSISDSVTFTVSDTTNPTIISIPNDLTVEFGYTGQSLSWTAIDANPDTYTIELQGSGIVAGPTVWTSGIPIICNIPNGFAVGVYIYTVNFIDDSDNSISDSVTFMVDYTTQRLQLELSGSFDFLLKEEIHLQIAGLLTDFFTGDPISEAIVTFDVYDPDGSIILYGEMVEEIAESGEYIYKSPLTIKKMGLPKGIYRIYAQAETSEGLKAVDMIQFHIDPPGDTESNPWLPLTIVGFGGLAFMGVVMIFLRRYQRYDK